MDRKLVFIFTIIFAIGLFTNVEAQKKKPDSQQNENDQIAGSPSAKIPKPADEARIIGSYKSYKIEEINLEYLQSLKMPGFKFVFETGEIESEDLPDEVENILGKFWKETLTYYHDTYLYKAKDGQAYLDKTLAWTNSATKSELKLQDIFIEAPMGSRKISQTESEKIIDFFIRNIDLLMISAKARNTPR